VSTPIEIVESNDPVAVPWRVALVRPDRKPAVRESEERYVATFPHLIIREVILFQLVVIGLSLAAILFDAPLESIANPLETPNPAKAPWYFLGLQELLHYFPPVVAGVLMPGLVVIALIVIPYARVNLEAAPLWFEASRMKTVLLASVLVAITALFAAFSCWPIVVPTIAIGVAMVLARGAHEGGWRRRLWNVTLPEWLMTWFVIIALVLTLIGTYFRGPGWSWVWPWSEVVRS
jgi:quinol-cytochrome oxidoreductase complex cytochrome b subunit